jgi:hydroxymethylbilane synthase
VIRLGTRGSALALAQARIVAASLGEEAEVVPVTTSGDRRRDAPDKEKWVKELELALLADEIDLAVHSAKDVPSALPDGLELVGTPARGDARDALCGAARLGDLPAGARIGTSSLRRTAQLRALREDLAVVEVRGNVDTRLRKLESGELDALVLAAAGLARLGRLDALGGTLDELVPAPGQGAIALEARAGDAAARAAAARVTDDAAWTCLACERALVRDLDASCRTPVGAHAVLLGDGVLAVSAFVGLPDGSAWVRDRIEGPAGAPEELGGAAAQRVLAAGGGELLRRAEALTA